MSAVRLSLVLLLVAQILFGQPVSVKQKTAVIQPRIFSEGIISTGDYESHAAFSPTGDTLYFVKSGPDISKWTICVSYFKNKAWSTPEVASFSGQYMDADPFFTEDGKTLYFISNRPIKPGSKVKEDFDIWKMERAGNDWSAPINLGEPINSDKSEYYPTLTDSGTLYFGSRRDGGKGNSDIYRSIQIHGEYQIPENLGDMINSEGSEYEPFIFPDENTLIFLAARPDHLDFADLYISFKKNGKWTLAQKLPPPINSSATEFSPKLSFDGKYFFFASSRNRNPSITEKPETTHELNKRLHSAGNGLSDIYEIDSSALFTKTRD